MKYIFFLFSILLFSKATAQSRLADSRQTSEYTYIYKITAEEARKLYVSGMEKADATYLHNRADSFKTGSATPRIPDGNYLLVKAVENSLVYELVTPADIYIDPISNGRDVLLFLHKKDGTPITGARVFLNSRQFTYIPALSVYRLSNTLKQGKLFIYSGDLLYYANLYKAGDYSETFLQKLGNIPPVKQLRSIPSLWHKNNYQDDDLPENPTERKYKGYMALNKPTYKPGDTLKLKAFVTNNHGKPYKKDLLLRLYDEDDYHTDTIVAVVHPYRAGGYTYEMKLTDSMNLRLDQDYLLTLEKTNTPRKKLEENNKNNSNSSIEAKRKVVMRATAHYEEYELKSIHFTARSDGKESRPGLPTSLYFTAKDENNLPVMDGRIDITITTGLINKAYGNNVFLPDTLWQHSLPVEAIGETKLVLPDSLFPAASFEYKVVATLRNTNNELHTKQLFLSHNADSVQIVTKTTADSLQISYTVNGKIVKTNAMVFTLYGYTDTMAQQQLTLPCTIKLQPLAKRYHIIAGNKEENVYPVTPSAPIQFQSSRTGDSILLSISNPHHLPLWYTVFNGEQPVLYGHSDSLVYKGRIRGKKIWSVAVSYLYAGTMYKDDYNEDRTKPQNLDIELQQPATILPGQTTTIGLTVKDLAGAPVSNVDVTAYAVTRKFKADLPSVPYLGRYAKYHEINNPLILNNNYSKTKNTPLDWLLQSKELHLDTNNYYRFLHPVGMFRHEEPLTDSTIQVAPFVVSKGYVLPVNMLYIDEEPAFFWQAEQLNGYSFAIDSPGYHSIRMRVADKEVTLDSVYLRPATKTIVSVNADAQAPHITIEQKPTTMTGYEKVFWGKYLIVIEEGKKSRMQYVQQWNPASNELQNYLIHYNKEGAYYEPSLIGPILPHDATFVSKGDFSQIFTPESGYIYNITKGLIKQKQAKTPYPFLPSLAGSYTKPELADYVLTTKDIDSLWQEYKYYRAATSTYFYEQEEKYKKPNAYLQIGKYPDSLLIKSFVLYKEGDPDFICIFPGSLRLQKQLPAGDYRLLVLLKDRRYQLFQNIHLKANGSNFYNLPNQQILEPDPTSWQIDSLVNAKELPLTLYRKRRGEEVISTSLNDIAPYPLGDTEILTRSGAGGVFVIDGVMAKNKTYNWDIPTTRSAWLGKPGASPLIARRPDLLGVSGGLGFLGGIPAKYGDASGGVIEQNDNTIVEGLLPTGSSLRKNFHDDAFWQPKLRTDDSGRASFTVTFPDDITNWYTYYLAMGSKKRTGSASGNIRSFKTLSGNLALPQFAIAGDTINAIGKALSYTQDTIYAQLQFFVNDTVTRTKDLVFQNAAIDSFGLVAHGRDSMKLKYLLQKTDGYIDGEEKSIPLYQPGTKETKGFFTVLNNDTSFSIYPDTAAGTLTLHAETLLLPTFADEIEHIRNYEYLCNEQLASKLIALLHKQKLDSLMGKTFANARDINKIIQKLNDGKNGLMWGWWAGNEEVPWISAHAISALLLATQQGYTTNLQPQQIIDYCLFQLQAKEPEKNIPLLEILQQLNVNVHYKTYADNISQRFTGKTPLQQQLALALVRQKAGLSTDLQKLIALHKQTMFGNWYWGDTGCRSICDNAIQNTLLMYQLLKNNTGYEKELRLMQNYFLEKRSTGHWDNTYESARILMTIMPDLMAEKQNHSPATITINGDPSGNFPLHKQVTHPGTVTVTKTGSAPVYFTAYQEHWNTKPAKLDGDFVVQSSFVENNRSVDTLHAGKPALLTVQVKVKADADFVMIEIPIPAGCSYKDKPQSWQGPEVHREYLKHKTSIFCQHLKAGNYTFSVSLTPRYTGRYQLNPAKAEMMYYPVFMGREGMKQVAIQ